MLQVFYFVHRFSLNRTFEKIRLKTYKNFALFTLITFVVTDCRIKVRIIYIFELIYSKFFGVLNDCDIIRVTFSRNQARNSERIPSRYFDSESAKEGGILLIRVNGSTKLPGGSPCAPCSACRSYLFMR